MTTNANLIEFPAFFFDGQSSVARNVIARLEGSELMLSGDLERQVNASLLDIAPPLGKARRWMQLPDGSRLETDHHIAVVRLEQKLGRNQGLSLIHRLEQRPSLVLVALVALVAVLGGALYFLNPFIAKAAAAATPTSVFETISEAALKAIDAQFLEDTKLSRADQAKYTAMFKKITKSVGGDYPYRLEFRRGDEIGPNAFALPSGIVLITDELVDLAKNDLEIEGVLAHEVGHVVGRHTARNIYQGLGLLFVVSTVAGDAGSASILASQIPNILIQNGYSQAFELEADAFGGKYMIEQGHGIKPMQDILLRLEKEAGSGNVPGFLKSHPSSPDRAKALDKLTRK
jgi:Zn-dependent protease with chaperone function